MFASPRTWVQQIISRHPGLHSHRRSSMSHGPFHRTCRGPLPLYRAGPWKQLAVIPGSLQRVTFYSWTHAQTFVLASPSVLACVREDNTPPVESRGVVVVATAGRVFTEDELLRVGDFCERHDLTIVSDEIHSDLILDEDVRHISMLALDNGVRANGLSHLLPKQMHV